jgi:tetratricopeptide (TPR) repeat protein
MHIHDCYRLFGLTRKASVDDIKSAYRRLALQYHPDINQSDPKAAEKFRQVKDAYNILLKHHATQVKVKVDVTPPQAKETVDPVQKLKRELKRVQKMIREKPCYTTVFFIEELRKRYPNAPEVVHWQAIAYYRWGKELLQQGKYIRARDYLTRVLSTDPQNRGLCYAAKRNLDQLDELQVSPAHPFLVVTGFILVAVFCVFISFILYVVIVLLAV